MIVPNEINVVFASDDNYIQHATVAMMSIVQNSTSQNHFVFYVLDDSISEYKKNKAKETFLNYNVEVKFLQVDTSLIKNFYVSGQLSRAAYLRLMMTEMLPATVEKVIYLDCDLLVLTDIEKLWNFDMQGNPLAAVPDYGIMASAKNWRHKQKSLGLKKDDLYFNSGVLIVDVAQWRSKKYGAVVIDKARENNYQHHDQDALNKVFYRNWLPLPIRWNVIPPIWNLFLKVLCNNRFRKNAIQARKNMAILHYAGGYKPWEYEEISMFNGEYYSCLRKTSFCDVEMPQFDKRRKGRSIKRQLNRLRWAEFWQKNL